MRIVSLLPSATEVVTVLGLREQLVGVSHECDFPASVIGLPTVTRSAIGEQLSSAEIDAQVRSHLGENRALYHLDIERLIQLKPDLIVTQALCDVCAVSAEEVNEAVCQLPGDPQVVNLEPSSLQDVFDTIRQVGEATAHSSQADEVITALQRRVARVVNVTQSQVVDASRPRVAVLEWIDPLFNAGHWTPELVSMAGGIDCFGNLHQPSQQRDWPALVSSAPDVLFIALCGFDEQRSCQDLTP